MGAIAGFAHTSIQYRLLRGLACALVVLALAACGGGGGGGGGSDSGDGSGSGGDGGDGGDDGSASLSPSEAAEAIKRVDTSGAQGYMVTGAEGGSTSAAATGADLGHDDFVTAAETAVTLEPDSIYKITEEGELVRVPVEDDAGDEVPRGMVRPFSVKDINDTFVLMYFEIPGISGFTNPDDEFYCSADDGCGDDIVPYLVRKSDGAAFNGSDVFDISLSSRSGEDGSFRARDLRQFRTDDAGNLFAKPYRVDDGGRDLVRIDITDIDAGNVTASVLQEEDNVHSFAVDGDGDYVIYEGNNRTDTEQTVLRMVDVETGQLANLMPALGGAIDPDQVIDTFRGRTYVVENNVSNVGSSDAGVYRIEHNMNDGNLEPTAQNLGNLLVNSVSGESVPNHWPLFIDGRRGYERMILDGREIIVDNTDEPAAYELDLDRTYPDGEPRPTVYLHDHVTDVLSDVREARVSGQYIWFFGTEGSTGADAIVRYDPITEELETFNVLEDPETASQLDIDVFRVLSSDRVLFEATRLSDSATVVGEVDVNGNVTITDTVAADEPEVFTLEPISPADFLVIDGRVREWATSRRVNDDSGGDSAGDGDDLTFYSEWTGDGEYRGLVEFDGAIDPTHRTRLRFNDTHELRIDDGAATLVPIAGPNAYVDGDEQALSDVDGESAIQEAVEFRLPVSALGSPSGFDVAIARVGDADVEDLSAEKANGTFSITVDMATPLGDGTVALDLIEGYALTIEGNGDSLLSVMLSAIGGTSLSITDAEIEVVIPEQVVGSPADGLNVQVAEDEGNKVGGAASSYSEADGEFTVTLTMDEALGDGTVVLDLIEGYSLAIDGADGGSGELSGALTSVDGTTPNFQEERLQVDIEASLLGDPASLSLEETSTEEVLDTLEP